MENSLLGKTITSTLSVSKVGSWGVQQKKRLLHHPEIVRIPMMPSVARSLSVQNWPVFSVTLRSVNAATLAQMFKDLTMYISDVKSLLNKSASSTRISCCSWLTPTSWQDAFEHSLAHWEQGHDLEHGGQVHFPCLFIHFLLVNNWVWVSQFLPCWQRILHWVGPYWQYLWFSKLSLFALDQGNRAHPTAQWVTEWLVSGTELCFLQVSHKLVKNHPTCWKKSVSAVQVFLSFSEIFQGNRTGLP